MSAEQRDQSSTDIVIVALAVAAIFLLLQTEPVQLTLLSTEAALDAKIASAVGERETAQNLGTFAGWCYKMAFDEKAKKAYRLDLQEAKAYHARVSSKVAKVKTFGVISVSLLLLGLIGWGALSDARKAKVKESHKPNPNLDALVNAKNLILARAPKQFHPGISKAKDPGELLTAYLEIRAEVNIPNNLVARCWPYGSKQRKMFLDACRELVLTGERK